jgi:hypothetical protein
MRHGYCKVFGAREALKVFTDTSGSLLEDALLRRLNQESWYEENRLDCHVVLDVWLRREAGL